MYSHFPERFKCCACSGLRTQRLECCRERTVRFQCLLFQVPTAGVLWIPDGLQLDLDRQKRSLAPWQGCCRIRNGSF